MIRAQNAYGKYYIVKLLPNGSEFFGLGGLSFIECSHCFEKLLMTNYAVCCSSFHKKFHQIDGIENMYYYKNSSSPIFLLFFIQKHFSQVKMLLC